MIIAVTDHPQRSGRPDQQERNLPPRHHQQDHHHQGQPGGDRGSHPGASLNLKLTFLRAESSAERGVPGAAEGAGEAGGEGPLRLAHLSAGGVRHVCTGGLDQRLEWSLVSMTDLLDSCETTNLAQENHIKYQYFINARRPHYYNFLPPTPLRGQSGLTFHSLIFGPISDI